MIRFLVVLALVVLQYGANAQSQIRLLNGKVIESAKVEQNDSLRLVFYTTSKGKLKKLDFEELYSISSEGKKPFVFYKSDTLNNQLTVEEMNFYLLGEQAARRNFKGWPYLLGGVGIGAGSVFVMPAVGLSSGYSPLLASGLGLGVGFMPIKNVKCSKSEMIENANFKEGYRSAAKRRRNRNLFVGIGIGLAAGIATSIAIGN